MQRPHPLHVTASQVVVYRYHVHSVGQSVQEGRQRRDQRLPFAGHHFGNCALVQNAAAD